MLWNNQRTSVLHCQNILYKLEHNMHCTLLTIYKTYELLSTEFCCKARVLSVCFMQIHRLQTIMPEYYCLYRLHIINIRKNVKSFPSHMGKQGGTDLCIHSPQPDTSLCCEVMDMRLVHRVVFLTQLSPVPSYTAW